MTLPPHDQATLCLDALGHLAGLRIDARRARTEDEATRDDRLTVGTQRSRGSARSYGGSRRSAFVAHAASLENSTAVSQSAEHERRRPADWSFRRLTDALES